MKTDNFLQIASEIRQPKYLSDTLNPKEFDIQRLIVKANVAKQDYKEDQFKNIVKKLEKQYKIQIQRIKNTAKNNYQSSKRQIQQNDINVTKINTPYSPRSYHTEYGEVPHLNLHQTKNKPGYQTKSTRASKQFAQKNKLIDDMAKMVYDRKFKNFINHKSTILQKNKQQFLKKKARKPFDQDQLIREQDILSNTDSDFDYKNAEQMRNAYKQIFGGKRASKNIPLKHAMKYQYQFRIKQFKQLQKIQKFDNNVISKELVITYLFNQIQVMMLYSINPYLLGDQISEYATEVPDLMNFQEFSCFLLLDRSPTFFKYTRQVIQEAKKIGKGIKCAPIIAKWIDQSGIYELLLSIFKQVDVFGNDKAQRGILASKIKKQAIQKNIIDTEVIQIVNINKKIPLSRLIYQIQYEQTTKSQWTLQEFKNYLDHYHRLKTGQKDKIIQKQILAGKYDVTYIFIVNLSVLAIVKQCIQKLQKYAQYFVLKNLFIEKLMSHQHYPNIKKIKVRKQPCRNLPIETIEQMLHRFYFQAEQYCDLQEILQFFTNRGRPRSIQNQIYLKDLEQKMKQIQNQQIKRSGTSEDSSDDQDEQQFGKVVKERKVKRFLDKIEKKKREARAVDKVYNITIPLPFQMTSRDQNKKVTIREKKLKEMLIQKQQKLNKQLAPIKSKEVPQHVKESLYEKFKQNQDRARKQRLDQFRAQMIQKMVPMSDRLVKPRQLDIHCPIDKNYYQFVAKPVPWYCQIQLLQRFNKTKQQRKAKILQQVINRQLENDLPEGIQSMLARNQQQEKRKKIKAENRQKFYTQYTFQPKISDTNIPDFNSLHQHLKIELQFRKKQNQPTIQEPFSFDSRMRQELNRNKSQQVVPLNLSKTRVFYKQFPEKPATTLKYQALVKLRKQQQKKKQKQKQKQKDEQRKRKLRKEKFTPFVHQALRKNQVNQINLQARRMEFKKQQKQKQHQYEQQMLKIYNKVMNRPLLIENSGQYGQKQINRVAKLNYERSPRQKNIPEKQVSKQKKVKEQKSKGSRIPVNDKVPIKKSQDEKIIEQNLNQMNHEDFQVQQQQNSHPQMQHFEDNQKNLREYEKMKQKMQNQQDYQNQQQEYEQQYQEESGREQRNSI